MSAIAAAVAAAVFAASPLATFSVDGRATSSSAAVATVQPRAGAPGYSWLRIYFYPSPLAPADAASARSGRVGAIKAKWSAVLQLTVDKSATVWQIDLSLPGHTCTIAESDREAAAALQEFRFDGVRVRLKGKGTRVCDLALLRIPNQTFAWDVDLESAVVEGAR
jgi:hypothetical protein